MNAMKIVSMVLAIVLSLAVGIALFIVSHERLGFYTALFYVLLAVAFIWLSHFMWRWMYQSGYRRGYRQGQQAGSEERPSEIE